MKVRCPTCREWTRWEENPHRPFCSEKCRNQDLGNWATERYRIPVQGQEVPESKPSSKEGEEGEER
jgi:endogenous inhibitor of DNA gyrase (YacG/DUF329 family)